MAYDRQAEPEPAILFVRAAVALPEPIENERKEFFFDSRAAVTDRHFEMRVDVAERDADTAVSGHKLNRVRNQIPHNLLQSYWIAKHRSGAEIERNVHSELFCFCCRPQRFHRGVYHRGQIHGLGIKA